jgi:hypothetical protein
MEHRSSLSAAAREIQRIDAGRKKLIEMVMEGVAPSVVKDELNANAASLPHAGCLRSLGRAPTTITSPDRVP